MGTPRKYLAGQRFGSLTVLREGEPHVFPRGISERTWVCKCDCGEEITVTTSRLTSGSVTSCGCQSRSGRKRVQHHRRDDPADLTGLTFGNYYVLGAEGVRYTKSGNKRYLWRIRCNLCGREYVKEGSEIRRATSSIGCGCQIARMKRICLRCGAEFEGYPRTRYCPDCKAKEKLLKNASKPVKSGKALRKCKCCDKNFWADAGSDVYMCPECAQKARSGSVLRTRVCQMCGVEFEGYPRSKYCPDCQKIAKAEASRKSKQRKKSGTTRAIGSIDICQNCGQPYTVTGGLQKYCPDCAEKVTRENIQAHKRTYNADRAEQLNAHKDEMRSNRRVCVVCGKTFDSKTRTITCSPECAKIRAEQMRKRNRQKKNKKKEKANAENN